MSAPELIILLAAVGVLIINILCLRKKIKFVNEQKSENEIRGKKNGKKQK